MKDKRRKNPGYGADLSPELVAEITFASVAAALSLEDKLPLLRAAATALVRRYLDTDILGNAGGNNTDCQLTFLVLVPDGVNQNAGRVSSK